MIIKPNAANGRKQHNTDIIDIINMKMMVLSPILATRLEHMN